MSLVTPRAATSAQRHPACESLEGRLLLHGGHAHDDASTPPPPEPPRQQPAHDADRDHPRGGRRRAREHAADARHRHGRSPRGIVPHRRPVMADGDRPVVIRQGRSRMVLMTHHNSPRHANDGNPATEDTHYLAETGDAHHFAWVDRDPATYRIEVLYDFRAENGFANQITAAQQAAAEAALGRWEDASLGRLSFVRSTTAARADIVNIGTGNLAAVGAASGPRGTLGAGGGAVTHDAAHRLTNGVAWMDVAENWDTVLGNGDPAGTFDYFTAVAHEIGHALGLGHTTNTAERELMDGSYVNEVINFFDNDLAHIQSLYNPLVNGTLTIIGEDRVDHISMQQGMQLRVSWRGNSIFDVAAVTNIVVNTNGGDDAVQGTVTLPRVVNGGDGNDWLNGGAEADTFDGGPGNDTLLGDSGHDVLVGGTGNDLIEGEGGEDTLRGGDGNDTLRGGPAEDDLFGEGGVDMADYAAEASGWFITLDDVDNDWVTAGATNRENVHSDIETVVGTQFADTIIGQSTIVNNNFQGLGGNDFLDGGPGDDILRGHFGNDTIFGRSGNDEVTGEEGNDILDGGMHGDEIVGGPGDDVLTGGSGADTLAGNDGADVFHTKGDTDNGPDQIYTGPGPNDNASDRDVGYDEVHS